MAKSEALLTKPLNLEKEFLLFICSKKCTVDHDHYASTHIKLKKILFIKILYV